MSSTWPPPPPVIGWPGPPPPRRPWRWVGGLAAAAAIAGLCVVVVWLIHPASTASALTLSELDDGVQIGYPNARTTIDVFDEPLCPHCARFVTSSAADIERAVDAHKISVRYHLLNFLDHDSPSHDYSTRAVAASYCVAASGDPKVYTNFYVDLFADNFQPAIGATTDHGDADLADLARSVGAGAATDCIQSGQLVNTAKTKATNGEAHLAQLVAEVSTPRVFNGTTEIDTSQPGWVDRLRNAA